MVNGAQLNFEVPYQCNKQSLYPTYAQVYSGASEVSCYTWSNLLLMAFRWAYNKGSATSIQDPSAIFWQWDGEQEVSNIQTWDFYGSASNYLSEELPRKLGEASWMNASLNCWVFLQRTWLRMQGIIILCKVQNIVKWQMLNIVLQRWHSLASTRGVHTLIIFCMDHLFATIFHYTRYILVKNLRT